MNILVIGCGDEGAALCNALSGAGHEVSVISRDKEQFMNLSSSFKGYTTCGSPIDMDVLRKAGIESCEAFAAITSDDNTNLMAVQLAKRYFNVPRAFAMVTDPETTEVFAELGTEIICPTNSTVTAFCSAITGAESLGVTVGGHTVVLEIMAVPREFVGKRISDLEFAPNETLVGIEHQNGAVTKVLLSDTEFRKGDSLILARFAD